MMKQIESCQRDLGVFCSDEKMSYGHYYRIDLPLVLAFYLILSTYLIGDAFIFA